MMAASVSRPHDRDDDLPAVVRRVVVLCNPASGRGQAVARARQCAATLASDGHEVITLDIQRDQPTSLAEALVGADVLVVAGGDGTLHRALPALAHSRTAVYHCPMGTENLFAREFGMVRDARAIALAVRAAQTHAIDLARCNTTLFALFTGAGFDARVVHTLDQGQRGAITKTSYARPIIRTAREYRSPAWTVTVDGRITAERTHGALLIANTRQYGGRLDPAPRASMVDGRLDVVLLPSRGSFGLAAWALASRLRLHTRHPRLMYETGRHIAIQADAPPFPIQCDGEPTDAAVRSLIIEVMPGALRILVPPKLRGIT